MSSEPLVDVAVTLGLLGVTFAVLLVVPLFATLRASVDPDAPDDRH